MTVDTEPPNEPEKLLPPLSAAEEAVVAQDSATDPSSAEEALQLSSGLSERQLRERSFQNEADRTERFRDHFECLAIVTLYGVWLVLALLALMWVYHLIAFPCWPMLPEAQIDRIQSLLTGGVLVGLAGGYVKRRMNV